MHLTGGPQIARSQGLWGKEAWTGGAPKPANEVEDRSDLLEVKDSQNPPTSCQCEAINLV